MEEPKAIHSRRRIVVLTAGPVERAERAVLQLDGSATVLAISKYVRAPVHASVSYSAFLSHAVRDWQILSPLDDYSFALQMPQGLSRMIDITTWPFCVMAEVCSIDFALDEGEPRLCNALIMTFGAHQRLVSSVPMFLPPDPESISSNKSITRRQVDSNSLAVIFSLRFQITNVHPHADRFHGTLSLGDVVTILVSGTDKSAATQYGCVVDQRGQHRRDSEQERALSQKSRLHGVSCESRTSFGDSVARDSSAGQDVLMETNVRTPMEIFHLPQHLVVPLFQRPYVWEEDEQWLPLWQDVRRMAGLRLNDPYTSATHFLGAVVVQAHDSQLGHIPGSNIIDGQQRLTTLQLLMDAAGAVLEEAGSDALAGQLEGLTHNQDNFVQGGQTKLKIRHTNRDQAAFDEVMDAEHPVDHAGLRHAGSLLTRAHRYFTESVSEWLGDPVSDNFGPRSDALVFVLTRGLQLVAINLKANENSQEIFETLNARGTPLTAADLIKNFVFQRLESEGVDTQRAYAEDWPFESKFWETGVSVGRYTLTRGSLFLTQWLGSRTGEEVSPKSTFNRFKYFVEHVSGQKMSELLPVIRKQAELYEAWTVAAADADRALSVVEMSVYRMQAAGVELLKPLLIWLHEPDSAIPSSVVDGVVSSVESWVVRRQLLRLQSADLGRIVAEMIRLHRDVPPADLEERVRAYLTRLSFTSTYWPGDEEIRTMLTAESAYRRYSRGRLRMYLEAIEDSARRTTGQPPVPRRGYPIEHVMPQSWASNWPVEGLEAEQDRGAHIHRLGNLTLLTKSLNSSVSNGPWAGKRDKLQEHDTFLMNRLFRSDATIEWDEQHIDARSAEMIDVLLNCWPVPEGHQGEVVDPQRNDKGWVEIKDLVSAGLLAPGTRLLPRPGKWSSSEAIVRADGLLEVDGQTFETPSGAGKHIKGGATNGWSFWHLEDGRRLLDVRAEFTGQRPTGAAYIPFDWSQVHAILEALPAGHWTSYVNLADAVGTAAQPVGNHITSCQQCVNAHRVLTWDGKIAPNFKWADPADLRRPEDILREEGLAIVQGKADPARMLTSDDLAALVA